MGLMTFVSAMASLTFGRLRGRMGAKVIFVVGLAAMALGITVTGAGTTLLTVMCGTGLTGLGMGIAIPNIFASAMALASPQTRGRTAGVITASLFLGQFVSPLLGSGLITKRSRLRRERRQKGRPWGFGHSALLRAASPLDVRT
ncbi:MFS transporter [Puniceibacterium sp. IMCC21224]|uniref:MFS transporter n=1 Tax=Puniceibacterium sp. IMCC21224 TaxID=1618204 RepID=UPI0009E2D4D1